MLYFLNGYFDPRNRAPLVRLPKPENDALLVKVVNKALGREGEKSIVNASKARGLWKKCQVFKAATVCICQVDPPNTLTFPASVRLMRTIGAALTDAGNVSIDSSVPDLFHYLVSVIRERQHEFHTLNFRNCWSEEPKKPPSAKKPKERNAAKKPKGKKAKEDAGGDDGDRIKHVAFEQNCEILSSCLENAFANDRRFDRFVRSSAERDKDVRVAFRKPHKNAVATNDSVIKHPLKYPTDFGKGMAVVIETMKICTGDVHCLNVIERFNHPFAPAYDQYEETQSVKTTDRCRNMKWMAGFVFESYHFICNRIHEIVHVEEALIHTLRNGDDLLRNDRARKENWSKGELLAAKETWNTHMAVLRAEFIDEDGNPARAPASEGMIGGFVQVPRSIEDVNSDFKQVGKLPSTWQCTTSTRFINRVKSSLNQSVVADIFETILLYGLNPKFIDEMNEEEQARYCNGISTSA